MAEPGRGTDRRAECGHGLGRRGGPWPGKLEQGAAQAKAGDAGPPARPVLPGALRRAAAQICSQPSPPCLAPYPRRSISVEREVSGLWRVLVLSVPLLVRGHRDRLFPHVSSLLPAGQNPCFCPSVASCDTPAGPACPSHWWGSETRGGQTLTQHCTVSQGALGTGSDVVS